MRLWNLSGINKIMSIPQQLNHILSRIRAAEKKAGRPGGSAQLVAVSKTFPTEDIRACYDAGQRIFGENKVQEALGKIPALPADTEWHLIGPLQRNKVRKALEHFTLIHAVDSLRLAEFINTVAEETGKHPRILLEVNVGDEASKFGFTPDTLEQEWDELSLLPHICIAGLMCIPPPVATPEEARPYFRRLRELKEHLSARASTPMTELSMGMSHDFETAVEEGATLVRVGSAIFGGRTYATTP